MNKTIITFLTAAMCFLIFNQAVVAQYGVTSVEESEALDTEIVSGGTEIECIDKAVEENAGDGVRAIATSSGIGFVATATGYYSYSDNVDLTRVSQRAAAVNALYSAKYKLAQYLFGCSIEGKTLIAESASIIMSEDKGTLVNASETQAEAIATAVSGSICGAVTYSFEDHPGDDSGAIIVSIVTTPRTRGDFSRGADQSTMHAHSLKDTIKYITSELTGDKKNGLVSPPNGGRTIALEDGSTAWVGFGSAQLVDMTGRSGMQKGAIKKAARGVAATRALNSLFKIIKGEKIEGWEGMGSAFTQSANDFETLMDEEGGETIQKMKESEESMHSVSGWERGIVGETSGDTPPGCDSFEVQSADSNWITIAYVWHPDISEQAAKAAEDMKASSPFKNAKPTSASGGRYQTNSDGSFKRDKTGKVIPVSLGSGRVSSDEDL
jgi:hypothetical protein